MQDVWVNSKKSNGDPGNVGYQIMKRLKDANLVIHERIFHARNGVFYLTRKGAECSDLAPIKNIPKDNYIHQLAIIDVYFKMMARYPEAPWVSKRRITRDKSTFSVGRKIQHLADAVLIFPDDRQVAIEVELTMKSKRRLENIMDSYLLHKRIKEVWYFCPPESIEKVRRAAGGWKHIKVYELNCTGFIVSKLL